MAWCLANYEAWMRFNMTAKSMEADWVFPEDIPYTSVMFDAEDWVALKLGVGLLHALPTINQIKEPTID